MDRREFMRKTAMMGAGFSLLPGLSLLAEAAETSGRPDLAVVHGASPEKIVKAAIDALEESKNSFPAATSS